jgi:hypothetical protein
MTLVIGVPHALHDDRRVLISLQHQGQQLGQPGHERRRVVPNGLVVEVTRDAIAAPGRLSGLQIRLLQLAREFIEQVLGALSEGRGAKAINWLRDLCAVRPRD